ncbi:MAG: LysR family transcriptional regulator [Alphaproteobacteria bacterium TMED89]|nr:transcriptional regulator [Rhodospirillaceae bacterium]RPH16288.1 MAG: LysR family transcriptional regulator [Alphaproteobacteria bacterium TMED89]
MLRHSHLIQNSRLLIVFEAAARLQSFTRAAEELSMQQPSVSGSIRQLEENLNLRLFDRSHRKIELTRAGQRLFGDIAQPLGQLEDSLHAVRQQGELDYVTLSTSTAFSYYWLMPRVPDLRLKHPDIDLRMLNSDRDPELAQDDISLGIRLGKGDWIGYEAVKLAEEIIYPVASPRFLDGVGALDGIEDLSTRRLIHLEEPVRVRPTWSQWFGHHGLDSITLPRGLRLNDYALVLQAAVSGEGYAFGWDHIVRTMIERGLLVGLTDWAWHTGNGAYLVWPKDRPLAPKAEQVRDWIVETTAD